MRTAAATVDSFCALTSAAHAQERPLASMFTHLVISHSKFLRSGKFTVTGLLMRSFMLLCQSPPARTWSAVTCPRSWESRPPQIPWVLTIIAAILSWVSRAETVVAFRSDDSFLFVTAGHSALMMA